MTVAQDDEGREVEFNSFEVRMSRMVRRVREWVKLWDLSKMDMIMITLTYALVDDWKARDITEFLQSYLDRHPVIVGYAWRAEMQKRGAVHYHVLFVVPKGVKLSFPDVAYDGKPALWFHGRTNVELARTPYYIVKYVGKKYQSVEMPKGCRIFAVWVKAGVVDPKKILGMRVAMLPTWLRVVVVEIVKTGIDVKWSYKAGLWWVNEMMFRSPWRIIQF